MKSLTALNAPSDKLNSRSSGARGSVRSEVFEIFELFGGDVYGNGDGEANCEGGPGGSGGISIL